MNKQIEEMAKHCCFPCDFEYDGKCVENKNPSQCYIAIQTAETLYNAGYRKQSEGEWEKRVFIIFDSEKTGYRCPECNTTWDTDTNFCPHCGAKMKGLREGTQTLPRRKRNG